MDKAQINKIQMDKTQMKKRPGIVTNSLTAVLMAVILIPALTLPVWIFAERWAWPDLVPQVFSLRSVREVFGRGGELGRLMLSSVLLSVSVAFLSAVIGTMTARALVFYSFRGKALVSFLTVLPFMVPSTVFAMGVQLLFIRM